MKIDTSTTAGKIEVMQAFIDGKGIEGKAIVNDKWIRISPSTWDWKNLDYRIAPQTVEEAARESGRERFYETNDQYEAHMSGFVRGSKWKKEQKR